MNSEHIFHYARPTRTIHLFEVIPPGRADMIYHGDLKDLSYESLKRIYCESSLVMVLPLFWRITKVPSN